MQYTQATDKTQIKVLICVFTYIVLLFLRKSQKIGKNSKTQENLFFFDMAL